VSANVVERKERNEDTLKAASRVMAMVEALGRSKSQLQTAAVKEIAPAL
jgi:hypothetical protein